MSATSGKGAAGSVAKVVEITATSPKSFEDAIHGGVARASKTLEGIQGAWIKEQKIIVAGGKVIEFRVNMSVTFLLKD
jgi:flavin-binding protein dodecin